ncbi:hypothetical protein LT706_12405 [Pseudomonas syringae pv. syringae]|uniref:hypothetical protein n=1 Tax=Pseudomonas syringae TaxID=317 RepID=UPI00200B2FBE|nr:hypothetical protein [Pseudomonas syringae]MCK9712324.1 hypothetical protein [Pseudomonas syringae pv. syringae]
MSRPHTLIKFKQAQHVLSKVLTELRVSQRTDPNYQLDLEFDEQLNLLLERYGYDASQAMALIARYEAIEASMQQSPEGNLAKIYSSRAGQNNMTSRSQGNKRRQTSNSRELS